MSQEIAEFLLARIAEDETSVVDGDCRCEDGQPQRPDCPDRILAECDAKRRIVRDYEIARDAEYGDIAAAIADERTYGRFLRLFALPYADHPDYREEWRP